jgi:hypothetical protein
MRAAHQLVAAARSRVARSPLPLGPIGRRIESAAHEPHERGDTGEQKNDTQHDAELCAQRELRGPAHGLIDRITDRRKIGRGERI